MNKSISLPIFFNTENTEALKLCGIDYPLSECSTRDVIFYRIDAIADFYDENDNQRQYSEIHSSGNCFLCLLSKKDIAEMIIEAFNINSRIMSFSEYRISASLLIQQKSLNPLWKNDSFLSISISMYQDYLEIVGVFNEEIEEFFEGLKFKTDSDYRSYNPAIVNDVNNHIDAFIKSYIK